MPGRPDAVGRCEQGAGQRPGLQREGGRRGRQGGAKEILSGVCGWQARGGGWVMGGGEGGCPFFSRPCRAGPWGQVSGQTRTETAPAPPGRRELGAVQHGNLLKAAGEASGERGGGSPRVPLRLAPFPSAPGMERPAQRVSLGRGNAERRGSAPSLQGGAWVTRTEVTGCSGGTRTWQTLYSRLELSSGGLLPTPLVEAFLTAHTLGGHPALSPQPTPSGATQLCPLVP